MTCSRLSRFALAFSALLAPVAASAATPAGAMPPPGLYRIDGDSTVIANNGPFPSLTVRTQESGTSGNTLMTGKVTGQPGVTRQVAGQGPVTACIAAPKAGASTPPVAGCTSGPAVARADGTTFVNRCPSLEVTTVVRKLDAKTWQVNTRSVQLNAAPVANAQANVAGMQMMLENMAKNAPTAEERAEAKQQLAEFGKYKAEAMQGAAAAAAMQPQAAQMRAQARAEGIALPPAHKGIETNSVQTWTRIAETCGGGAAR